jgi:hypothetical protein
MRTICQTFDEFLVEVKAQARKFGREQLRPIGDVKTLTLGFESPDGGFVVPLSVVKGAFLLPDWRQNTELEAIYKSLGGQTPIQAMTRVPPHFLLIKLYADRVRKAIEEGEKLRALH